MAMIVTLYLISCIVYNAVDAPKDRGFSNIEVWMLGTQFPILLALFEYGVVLYLKRHTKRAQNQVKIMTLEPNQVQTMTLDEATAYDKNSGSNNYFWWSRGRARWQNQTAWFCNNDFLLSVFHHVCIGLLDYIVNLRSFLSHLSCHNNNNNNAFVRQAPVPIPPLKQTNNNSTITTETETKTSIIFQNINRRAIYLCPFENKLKYIFKGHVWFVYSADYYLFQN